MGGVGDVVHGKFARCIVQHDRRTMAVMHRSMLAGRQCCCELLASAVVDWRVYVACIAPSSATSCTMLGTQSVFIVRRP